MTLTQYHARAAAATASSGGEEEGKRSEATYYGYGSPLQPPWVAVSSRGCLLEPSLDVASHLSQQLQVDFQLRGYNSSGSGLSPEDYNALLSRATTTGNATNGSMNTTFMDPKKSCFALHLAKRQHHIELSRGESGKDLLSERERERAQRERYHHQQAIFRHERSLARRRAASAYTGLTAAQADAALSFPNAYTLDRLATDRYAGRWPLDNPHRQQLLRGVPVMTQIMHGDFYQSYRGRLPGKESAAAPPTRSRSLGDSRAIDTQRLNKRDAPRVGSAAINASTHRSRSHQRRAGGVCHCTTSSAS